MISEDQLKLIFPAAISVIISVAAYLPAILIRQNNSPGLLIQLALEILKKSLKAALANRGLHEPSHLCRVEWTVIIQTLQWFTMLREWLRSPS